MSELKKAELVEINGDSTPQPVGKADVVQFNPTSLRVQISNRTAGGQQAGAQARQRPGTGEMSVSFDLVFDTADSGEDVLRQTGIVERYVRPKGNRPGEEAPPRVQFTWGSFQVQGVMESANTDIDLFSADGTPLRAKVAVSIKGQDPRWSYQPAPSPQGGKQTAAAGQAANLPPAPVGTPGGSGSGKAADKVAQAMPGEGLAQLASRLGLAAEAWRALADGIDDPLSLKLGQEVPVPAGLAQGAAGGAGTQGKDPARATAGLGLVDAATAGGPAPATASASNAASTASASRRAPLHSGLALAAQGGVGNAIAQAHAQRHQSGADASLAAFGMAAAGAGDASVRPWGAGVPLRPRFGADMPAARRDPTLPGWQAAPAAGRNAVRKHTGQPAPTADEPGCGCKKD
ncbi:MAG: hypothetical protein AB1831_08350 [Pseudomonadota bacterium]